MTPDEGENAHRFSDRVEAAVATLSREVHSDWWQARRRGERGRARRGGRARPRGPEASAWRRAGPSTNPRPAGRHGVARLTVRIEHVGTFSLGWGESLVWDDRTERLYFVDCAAQTLHWLDGGRPPLHAMALPSMAAGIVLTEEGTLVGALDDGLHVLDADAGTTSLLAAYPPVSGRGPTTPAPTSRAT